MTVIQSEARRQMIEAGGRLCQLLGLPRSTGQIYGLLYMSSQPLSLNDIVDMLGISKASASIGTRQLASWGAVKQVWIQGNRRDYFEAIADLNHIIRGALTDIFKPRLSSSETRLQFMRASLDEEFKQGILSQAEYKLFCDRVKSLERLQKKLQTVIPIAENLV